MKLVAAILGRGVIQRKCFAGPVLPLWAGKAGFGVLHSKEMPFCYLLEDRLL